MGLTFQQRYIAASMATDYKPDQNLVVAPFSAERQLAMLAAGAVGQSFQEIADALGSQENNANKFVSTPYFSQLTAEQEALTRSGNQPATYVRSSAAFVTRRSFSISFGSIVRRLGGKAHRVNIGENLTDAINRWAAGATATLTTPGGLINPLLSQPVDARTGLAVLSADAFDMRFRIPFEVSKTTEAGFWGAKGEEHRVDMMQREFLSTLSTGVVLFKRGDEKGVILPYGRYRNFSLRLTQVPATASADATSLSSWYAGHIERRMNPENCSKVLVCVPRTTLSQQRDPRTTRNAFGIHTIYSRKADFSGMLQDPSDISIGQSLETAVLQVNEVGTQGAAVQADCVELGGERTPEIRFDGPYLIEVVIGDGLVKEDCSERILMAVVVNNPGRLPAPTL